MSNEKPPELESPESQLEQERLRLKANLGELETNLEDLENSSPKRRRLVEKITEMKMIAIFAGSIATQKMMGGGFDSWVEAISQGNWEKILIALGVGSATAVGLDLLIKRYQKPRE